MIKSNIRILRLSQTLNEFSGADEILTLASGGCFESKAILKFVSASKRKHKFRFIKVHNALLNHNYWITLGHNCDVASISSTKSRDSGTMQLDSGWKAFYSGVLSTVYFQRCGGNIRKSQGGSRGGATVPLKLTKVTLFTMILYNSENSIRDVRSFWGQLFCHSGVVKYTSSLSHVMRLDCQTKA